MMSAKKTKRGKSKGEPAGKAPSGSEYSLSAARFGGGKVTDKGKLPAKGLRQVRGGP